MDIKATTAPGMKLTEIGEIPEDWELHNAATLGRFKGGSGFPLRYQGNERGSLHFFKVSDMNSDGNQINLVTSANSINFEIQQELNAPIIDKGSIIFAKVGAAIFKERRRILSKDSCIDNNMCGYTVDKDLANPEFIYHLLCSINFADLTFASALPSLNNATLGAIKLVVPCLEEQKAIATALSDADDYIRGLEKLIDKKRAVKQGAMQELLTGRRRLPGFNENWIVCRLGEVASLRSGEGVTSRSISTSGGYPCYGGNGIRGYVAKYNLDGKYVLVGRVGALCGNIHYVSGKTFASEHALILTLTPKNNPKFLSYLLATEDLASLSEASAQPVISGGKLSKLKLLLPSNEFEQKAIAEVLSNMDDELTALETQLDKAKQIKQAMMQELLTGRIRLV